MENFSILNSKGNMGITPSIDITPNQRKTILSLLKLHIPGVTVWAYGSRLKWTSRPESDLDLIVFSTPEQRGRISALKEAFEESSLPLRVDVLVWDEVPDDFRQNILENYVVLVEKTEIRGSGMKYRFSKVCEIADVIDSLHKTPKYADMGLPMVRCTDVKYGRLKLDDTFKVNEDIYNEFSRRYKPKKDDIIITRVGSYGITALVDDTNFCLGQNTSAISPKINARYLYLALNSPQVKNQIEFSVVGSTQKTLSLKAINNLKIPRFDEAAEERIATIIGDLDDKIELNRQINQTLEQMAQAIFKSWFVDFEPVKAKIKAKEELRSKNSELKTLNSKFSILNSDFSSHNSDLFPDEMVESELGSIPVGWADKKLSDWGNVVCGKTPPKKDPSNYGGSIPFVKIPDMHGNVFLTKTSDTLSEKGTETQKKKEISKGSVCVSCIATVGQVVIASERSHTNQQINCIIPINLEHTSYLYFCMMERYSLLHDLASGGSATLNLNTGNFSKISLVFPGYKLLSKYSSLVSPMMESILGNDRQSQILNGLRDSLLPKLLSGEIAVGKTGCKKEAVV